MAVCYFEQIVDEKKDLGAIKDAKIKFNQLIEKYPNSEYAIDANFKLDLINEYLQQRNKEDIMFKKETDTTINDLGLNRRL